MTEAEEFCSLMIFEAANEFLNILKNNPDKENLIYAQMRKLGYKPGFVAAFTNINSSSDNQNLTSVAMLIGNELSEQLFHVKPVTSVENRVITFNFTAIPPKLKRFGPFDEKMTDLQKFWFSVYSHFISGVLQGAITHFGYKAMPTVDFCSYNQFKINLRVDDLDSSWDFASDSRY